MKTISIKEKNDKAFEALKATRGYTNKMQAPKIVKLVVSSGVGSFKDKKKIDLVAEKLTKITGQKAAKKGAKVSIATFKVREGDPVGFQTTLRGKRMYDFLDRLINVALPRTKDFRGISSKGIDPMGNYTLGIRENTIFPETTDEELKDVFGLAVTIVTTAKNKDEARAFFDHLGFPFKKAEAEEATKKEKKKRDRKPKPEKVEDVA
ncbi:MAG: 50S ribosomal protein L5 [Parcubacteria group bacterium]|nr:50S ribosomal protein L5 [Parcubacteria group bacterium]